MELRLHVIDALLLGQERHLEVVALAYDSADMDDAVNRACDMFQVDQEQARAMLEIQTWRLTKSERARVAAHRDELRALLPS